MDHFVGEGKAGGLGPAGESHPPARKLHPLAFGLERIGLISLRAPITGAVIFTLLVIAAVFGLDRLKVDDSLSQLFRSDTAEFKQYEDVTSRFPSSEFDVLVVVEGKNLLKRDELEKLRDVVTDLQLIDGTRGLISLFSARQPPENGHLPEALFPEPLPTGAAYDELIQKVTSNEIIRGKLLSTDGELALVVLALDPAIAESNRLRDVVGEIRKTVNDDLAGTDLSVELSGVPVMQLEIRNAVERDRLVYNAIGFLAGCLIAIVFFRRVSFMIVAAGPPLTAIVLTLGALGWLDFRLNMFLNVMTPLIMVISFSDSMQLTFAARDRLIAGESKRRRVPQRHPRGRPGLRAHPCDRGPVVRRLAVLQFRPDPYLRRGRHHRDRSRPRHRAHAVAVARRSPDPQGEQRLPRRSGRRMRRSTRCAASAPGSRARW